VEVGGLRGRLDLRGGVDLPRQVFSTEDGASCRKVFVDAVVLAALARLRPVNAQPDDLVFHTERGMVLNPDNVRNRVLIPACRRAGIPIVSWHNFRYTYSTWADPTGERIKTLQTQLGHTDSHLTLRVYTQPLPASQKAMASKLARVLLPIAVKLEEEETQDAKLTRFQRFDWRGRRDSNSRPPA
jgi:hypothetical protein